MVRVYREDELGTRAVATYDSRLPASHAGVSLYQGRIKPLVWATLQPGLMLHFYERSKILSRNRPHRRGHQEDVPGFTCARMPQAFSACRPVGNFYLGIPGAW